MVITSPNFNARLGVPAGFAVGKAHLNIRRAAVCRSEKVMTCLVYMKPWEQVC